MPPTAPGDTSRALYIERLYEYDPRGEEIRHAGQHRQAAARMRSAALRTRAPRKSRHSLVPPETSLHCRYRGTVISALLVWLLHDAGGPYLVERAIEAGRERDSDQRLVGSLG